MLRQLIALQIPGIEHAIPERKGRRFAGTFHQMSFGMEYAI
jgi:hypothetical protein